MNEKGTEAEHRQKNETNTSNRESSKKVYNYNNIQEGFLQSEEWQESYTEIIEQLLHNNKTQDQIDVIYNKFCSDLFLEIDKFIEYKSVKSKTSRKKLKLSKPYWDNELTEAWKEMAQAERRFLKCTPRENRRRLREVFKACQKKFDKMLRSKARQYNYKVICEIEDVCQENPVKFWQSIKKLGPQKKSEIPIKVNVRGEIITDEKTVKEVWRNDYCNLLNPMEEGQVFDNSFLADKIKVKNEVENAMLDESYEQNMAMNTEITNAEVEIVVQKLRGKKAHGVDSITNEVLKKSAMLPLLTALTNSCFENGIVPTQWNKGLIKPIPKGSDKDPCVPLNYRGITLISCVSKVYSSILNHRLRNYCEEENIFAEEQNGFRASRSCEEHIFSLTSVIQNRQNNNLSTFCAFIDLEKAFDWINRDLILYKLQRNRIDGNMYFALKSLLSNTQAQIILNDKVSTTWFDVKSGVKQGDPLSPTLFNIFINDLIHELKRNGECIQVNDYDLNSLLYADDMVLISESENKLQTLLNILQEWCFKWRVKVNTGKSEVIHFRKKNTLRSEHVFKLYDGEFKKVATYKYLGVILDEHLSYETCISTLSNSAGRALGGVINKFKSLRNVGYETFTKLFESGVKPIMEYGASIWGFKDCHKFDIIQNRAMRYYLGIHKFCTYYRHAG